MTRTYGEQVDIDDDVWRLDTGGAKSDSGKTQSRWWKQQVQLRGDITKESEEMQIEALRKGAYEAKGDNGEENIISQ